MQTTFQSVRCQEPGSLAVSKPPGGNRVIKSDIPEFNLYCYDKRFNDKYSVGVNTSPLTHMTLDCLQWCLSNRKNLMLAHPEVTVRSISLMAYLAAEALDSTSIIFTGETSKSKGHSQHHISTYSLLEDAITNAYLYSNFPLGVLVSSRDSMSLNLAIDLSRVGNRHFRKKYRRSLRESLQRSPRMIVLSAENYSEVVDHLSTVKLQGKVMGENVNLKVGSVFFENMDRIVNSSYSYRSFMDWIKRQLENKSLFFFGHFANPFTPYLTPMAEEIDAAVLHYGSSLARNNIDILMPGFMENLESKNEERRRKAETVSRLSLDSPVIWSGRTPPRIVYPPADPGNLYDHIAGIKKLGIDIMSDMSEENSAVLKPLFKLLRIIRKLSVHPYRLESRFVHKNGQWNILSLQDYMTQANAWFSQQKKRKIKKSASKFLNRYKAMCDELQNTTEYGNMDSRRTKGKPQRILEFIVRWSQKNEDRTLIVGVSDYTERRLLLNDIREHIGDKNVEVRLISNLSMSVAHPHNEDLLLPFPLSPKHFSEYLKPYHQVHIIVYDGHELQLAKEHIEMIRHANYESEKLSMDHLKRTFEEMGLDPVEHALYGRIRKVKRIAGSVIPASRPPPKPTSPPLAEHEPIEKRIMKFLGDKTKFPLAREEEFAEKDFQEIEEALEVEVEEVPGEKVILKLSKLETDRTREITVRPHRPIIVTHKDVSGTDIEEVPAIELKEGDLVVIPFGEARRDMTDIIVDLFSEDKDIDTELLSYWKEMLCNYRTKNGLSYRDLYEDYRYHAEEDGFTPRAYQTVIIWTKEWRIAPQHWEDIVAIGKMTENWFLIDNAQNTVDDAEKMRALRRRIGRLMNKVIKEVVGAGVSTRDTSYDEAALAGMVKESLFRIVSCQYFNE